MNCPCLYVVSRGNGKPAVAEADEDFTKASLHQPDRFGGIKETGKGAQKTQKQCIRACF